MFKKIRESITRGSRKRIPITQSVGWTSLSGLLEDLDEISKEHEEIFDTDVREKLWEFLYSRFILHDRTIEPPLEFGMFTPEGDTKIRVAFTRNLQNLDTIIEIFDLTTQEQRLTTFTNPNLRSAEGNHLDDYFGSP